MRPIVFEDKTLVIRSNGQCPFANNLLFLMVRNVLRGSAHGTIASSLAISFASRVV